MTFETDWLGVKKIFYNSRTLKVSSNILELIEIEDLEIDIEGLAVYLDFGYCAFGRTPLKSIQFLEHNQQLSIKPTGLEINEVDSEIKYDGYIKSVEEIHGLVHDKMNSWIKTQDSTIILPLSGGLDSRYLLSLIEDVQNVNAFSYGITKNQENSKEVVHAQFIANKLNVLWKHIPIEYPNLYINDWYQKFGISTHLHGMYHIEFYKKIQSIDTSTSLISGIIGDAWAGSVNIDPILSPFDVKKLGYSHGLNSSSSILLTKPSYTLADSYFQKNEQKLRDPKYRVIESMRFKMMLLRYLIEIPESLGMNAWSPFLYKDVALAMLTLPEELRKDRKWQRLYFEKIGLDVENRNLRSEPYDSKSYRLIIKNKSFKKLESQKLLSLIQKGKIKEINQRVVKKYKIYEFLSRLNTSRFHKVTKMLGYQEKQVNNLNSYLTLKPLDMLFMNLLDLGK